MSSELRLRNQSQQMYVRALSAAWRNGVQMYDPSVWLIAEPEIEEMMLRDHDIAHVMGFRRHLIAGRQWTLTLNDPDKNEREQAKMAADVAKRLLNRIKHFTQARLNLARAFFSGARFSRIHGENIVARYGDGRPRLWWHPVWLEDADKRFYRIKQHNDGKSLSAHWERWNLPQQKWDIVSEWEAMHTIRHVYQDDQATLGHGRALREALGWAWFTKVHIFEESIKATERFAQGVLTARIDGARDASTGLPNAELISQWQEVLENLRSRHVLVYDKMDEINHLSLNSEGWQLMHTMRQDLREAIFTLVIGANLTTAGSEGGSYALAKEQAHSTEALIQYDRETLEETLTDDLLGCVWFRNWANLCELGIQELKPRFSIVQLRRQEPYERAQVATLLHNMGVSLSVDDVLEQTGFKRPESDDETIMGAETGFRDKNANIFNPPKEVGVA